MSVQYYHLEEGLRRKAAAVKLIATDVDGVLTDGKIIYDANGSEQKSFNVKDGFIVSHLQAHGIMVGAITARRSKAGEIRCEELGFDFHCQGAYDKVAKLAEVLEQHNIGWEEVAYIGDDLLDLPVLGKVGFSVCPADALPYIQEKANFISSCVGGQGVFREVGDMVLQSKGLLDKLIQQFDLK